MGYFHEAQRAFGLYRVKHQGEWTVGNYQLHTNWEGKERYCWQIIGSIDFYDNYMFDDINESKIDIQP